MDQDAKTFARTLRELGEQLDGSRDQDMVLAKTKVKSKDGKTMFVPEIMTAVEAEQRRANVLWAIPATKTIEPVPEVSSIEIYFNKKYLASCEKPTDALFWTDSSIEKFVYGYYEQLRIFPDLYKLVRSQLEDPSQRKLIVAVKHDNPSHPDVIGSPGGPPPPPSNVHYLVADADMVKENRGNAWFSPTAFALIFARLNLPPVAGSTMKKSARKSTAKKGRKRA